VVVPAWWGVVREWALRFFQSEGQGRDGGKKEFCNGENPLGGKGEKLVPWSLNYPWSRGSGGKKVGGETTSRNLGGWATPKKVDFKFSSLKLSRQGGVKGRWFCKPGTKVAQKCRLPTWGGLGRAAGAGLIKTAAPRNKRRGTGAEHEKKKT